MVALRHCAAIARFRDRTSSFVKVALAKRPSLMLDLAKIALKEHRIAVFVIQGV